jgi:hypothetical protein
LSTATIVNSVSAPLVAGTNIKFLITPRDENGLGYTKDELSKYVN